MLVVRQLKLVLEPSDGWRGVRLHVAFQVHVVLKGLERQFVIKIVYVDLKLFDSKLRM